MWVWSAALRNDFAGDDAIGGVVPLFDDVALDVADHRVADRPDAGRVGTRQSDRGGVGNDGEALT
jgi:hypothetical protein